MNNTKTNIIGAIAGLALLGVLALSFGLLKAPSSSLVSNPLGSTGGGGAGILSTLATTTTTYVFPNPTNFDYVRSTANEIDGLFLEGGYTASTSISETFSIGNCSTGTSTIFSVLNPFPGTSTVEYLSISGINGPTSTDITIGTSTTNSITSGTTNAGTTTLNEAIAYLATVGTTSPFTSIAGVRVGPNAGYNDPKGTPAGGTSAAVTNQMVGVGPGQYIIAFATSTYFNAGGTGGVSATTVTTPASCVYKIQWAR